MTSSMVTGLRPIRRALLSVSNKDGLGSLGQFLHAQGVELIASGGTAAALRELNLPVIPVEKLTGNPEAFGGRMKTLSFQMASGLLFRRDHEEDCKEAKSLGIEPIDLLVCNLYPFKSVLKNKEKYKDSDTYQADLIENIDVGGPTLIRAASKNFSSVTVLTGPEQYGAFMEEVLTYEGTTRFYRSRLAVNAFKLLCDYDMTITQSLSEEILEEKLFAVAPLHPMKALRYGENPHQKASWVPVTSYENRGRDSWKFLQGKELSYNNYLDADAALRVVSQITEHFSELGARHSCVTVIKHLTPCGLALSGNLYTALEMAWASDPMSAFGSIIGFNEEVDEKVASFFKDKFIEVLVAPSYSEKALEILKGKKNCRVLIHPLLSKDHEGKKEIQKEIMIRSLADGLLIQEEDFLGSEELLHKGKNKLPNSLHHLSQFGIKSTQFLKSNGIGIVTLLKYEGHDVMLLTGAGMGQPNRLDSTLKLAIPRYKENQERFLKTFQIQLTKENSVVISDAFFPFSDNVEILSKEGFKHIITPGGSLRDEEVINKCDELNISMAFTGKRHFRH